jgi:hypothetical protein
MNTDGKGSLLCTLPYAKISCTTSKGLPDRPPLNGVVQFLSHGLSFTLSMPSLVTTLPQEVVRTLFLAQGGAKTRPSI